jgi:hypothetical protein
MLLGSQKYLNAAQTQRVPSLTINDVEVPYVREAKNLGIIFDESLSWGAHTQATVKRVLGTLAQLRRTLAFIPQHVRKQLVQALIFPHFDYVLPLLTDISACEELKLQRAQNACIRFVTGATRQEHITPHYRQLGILKLAERRELALSILIAKIVKMRSPKYIHEKLKFASSHSCRQNRSSSNRLIVPLHRTVRYHKSFIIQAAILWNTHCIHTLVHLSVPCIKSRLTSIIQKRI